MNDHDLARYDDLIARQPRVPRLRSYDEVRRRSERSSRPALTVAVVGAAGAALVLAAALLASPPQRESSSAAVSRPIDLGSGLALAAPSGGLIAASDASGIRIYDADGRVVAATSLAARYARWLPDASGLVAQLDRPGATATTRLPFVVIERDGRLTSLGADLPGVAAAYLSVSPDGRSIAAQDDAGIILLDRFGVTPARALSDRATLVGWDARGRVLARDGATLRAIAPSGASIEIVLPADAGGRLEARLSPDRTATVVAGAGVAWTFEADRLVPLPAGISSDLFAGPREVLGRRQDGRIVAYDLRTGTARSLNAVLDDATWRAVRGISDGVLVSFNPLGGEARLFDLATGEERVVRGLAASSTLQPLGAGRFLVTGGVTRILSFAAPRP